MAYDEDLAARIRKTLGDRAGVTEKKMFGGVAFLLEGSMFCGVANDELMLRVGPERHDDGVSLPAFTVYRTWSALNGLVEHANIRVPRWLDGTLSLVTTWPNMHKVHHSREPDETNTNYGNIFSWFDRLFSTYTASWRGTTVRCGLVGTDHLAQQTTSALLAIPFRVPSTSRADSVHALRTEDFT